MTTNEFKKNGAGAILSTIAMSILFPWLSWLTVDHIAESKSNIVVKTKVIGVAELKDQVNRLENIVCFMAIDRNDKLAKDACEKR